MDDKVIQRMNKSGKWKRPEQAKQRNTCYFQSLFTHSDHCFPVKPVRMNYMFRPNVAIIRFAYICVAQPFYTRGTLNIVEESWRHTDPILHIVGGMDVLLSNSI
jgi:hypothetical protein